jgi:hypothetical protein
MRNFAIIAILSALLPAGLAHAEPLDRIAVTIGNHVITESELILDLRVGAFLDRAPVDLSPAARRRSAERLVDQFLILREATESHLKLPTEEDAITLLSTIKAEYGTLTDYRAALKSYGIEERDVVAQLLAGLIGITFTDLRFRPAIQVSEEDLRAYYAKLKLTASFEDSREQLEELITRQRTTEALDQWLATTRATTRIEYREQAFQ